MNIKEISIRYAILALFTIVGFKIIYNIATPPTYFATTALLNLIYPVVKNSSISFSINELTIILVHACIAGAAYYLLIALNLATPMPSQKRFRIFIFTIFGFFTINLMRLLSLTILALKNPAYFNITHQLTWHLTSTIIVCALWFTAVKKYKIRAIPGYTDIILLKNIYHR